MERTGPLFVCAAVLTLLCSCMTNEGVTVPTGPFTAVRIDAGDVIARVSPYLLNGFNFNNAMQVYTIRDLIDTLGIRTITYPAGEFGDEYDPDEASLTYFRQQQEYLETPFTFMQVRLYGGTPEKAAETVRLVKKLGIRVDVWTVGNEANLYTGEKSDPSWTPEKYCKVFREYAAMMKEADPDIKLAGPAVSQPVDTWIRTFIHECGDIVDVLAWHWYPTDGKWDDLAAVGTSLQSENTIRRYKGWLTDPEFNPKGYDRPIKTAITEWALHWDTPRFRHLTDMTAVLWTAQALAVFAEEGLDYAHYFCLNRYGGHAIFNQLNKPRLLYYLFVLFSDHWGKEIVASSQPDRDLHVWATKDDDGDISVFLVHTGREGIRNVELSLDNFPAVKKAEAWELVEETRLDREINRMKLKTGETLRLPLQPWSVTVVRIRG
ncbi:MAG: hypothetical protein JW881_07390 [Spirochaetales bacterium]|nr:hypothetical protein [Spirochaetales bacterium]